MPEFFTKVFRLVVLTAKASLLWKSSAGPPEFDYSQGSGQGPPITLGVGSDFKYTDTVGSDRSSFRTPVYASERRLRKGAGPEARTLVKGSASCRGGLETCWLTIACSTNLEKVEWELSGRPSILVSSGTLR